MLIISTLFFMWAMALNLNDILVPHLKKACDLTDLQSALIQTCYFSAYFLIAMPAGWAMKRVGYKRGILSGLLLCTVGAFLFFPASHYRAFGIFLFALFVMASGAAFLEVAANAYVVVLGNAETSELRLNMVQTFNALGAAAASKVGKTFILSGIELSAEQQGSMSVEEMEAYRSMEAGLVRMPYFVLGSIFLAIAVLIFRARLPDIDNGQPSLSESAQGKSKSIGEISKAADDAAMQWHEKAEVTDEEVGYDNANTINVLPQAEAVGKEIASHPSHKWDSFQTSKHTGILHSVSNLAWMESVERLWRYPQFVRGVTAQFFYVGAQVGICSFLIRFVQDVMPDFTEKQAAECLFYHLMLFLFGRIVGTLLMNRVKPISLLLYFACCCILLCLLCVYGEGTLAVFAVVTIGFFNSIMFPTIFSLSVRNLGDLVKVASSLLVMSVVGGALMPAAMGLISDWYGIRTAFILLVLAYAVVVHFALFARGSSSAA